MSTITVPSPTEVTRPTPGAAYERSERPDGPPPRAARELEPDPAERVTFEAEGESWVAWVSGKAAGGTGGYGLGLFDAVHFAPANGPDSPLREALLARGAFVGLFEPELRFLLARARPIVIAQPPLAANGDGSGA